MKFATNMLLTCILYCDTRCGCDLELFASTVGIFLSRISYLSSYVLLPRHCSFTFEKAIRLSRDIMLLAAIQKKVFTKKLSTTRGHSHSNNVNH